LNTRALAPSYLDVSAVAGVSEGSLAYSAVDDGDEVDHPDAETRRKPLALVSGAIAGVAAVAAGFLIVSLTADVHPTAAQQTGTRDRVETPAMGTPATELPAQVLLPGMSSAPASAPAPPPPVEVAVPPPPVVQQPPQTVTKPAQAPVYLAPAPQPRRAPARQAPPPVETPVPQAPPPAPPPAAAPAPPPAAPAPVMTAYLHLPFFSIPIPINPPAPPPPAPAPPGP
jgi:hypothetical protein